MTLLNRAVFKATHNSYSGGSRGTIAHQLDSGVRLIELDIWAEKSGFEIGHGSPGDQVAKGNGNPDSIDLQDWIAVIYQWLLANPGSAPVQLVLDVKSAPSTSAANSGNLNAILASGFQDKLVTPRQMPPWPDVESLSGKVFVVLSGNSDWRESYLLDSGKNPAVSINASNVVVEVHESQSGNNTLWYWTGILQSDGTVAWKHHGQYDNGTTPAVSINDAGWVVEVHKSQSHDQLWYHVGQLTADYDIAWMPSSVQYDPNPSVHPTVCFNSGSSNYLTEIHQSSGSNQNWLWQLTLDPKTSSLWKSGNAKTSDPRWTINQAGQVNVQVSDGNVLVYSTSTVDRAPICYEQLAFTEYQDSDSALLQSHAVFVAENASNTGFLQNQRLAGWVARAWQFGENSPRPTPPASYPATDTPNDKWYTDYCNSIGVIK
jgi:hypothetical protein